MMRVLILGVRFYDFVAKDTGERINFARVFHVSPDVTEKNTKGLVVSELNISIDNATKFALNDASKVPAVYDLDFEIRLDYKGNPKPTLVSCNLVNLFDIHKVMK